MGTEARFALVHREVGDAAAELEQLLARVAVLLVLPDRIVHRLLGQAVLQLEGEDRQAVDEQPDVQRPLGLGTAVAQLPCDGEAVLLEPFPRLLVARRRRAVEQLQVVRDVLDAVAQHVNGAALRDFALQPRQELAPRRTVLVQRQRIRRLRLGGVQKGRKLNAVDAILAVVVVGITATPADAAVARLRLRHLPRLRRIAGMPGQRRADQPFEAAFGGVGGHDSARNVPASTQPFATSTSTVKFICRIENCFLRLFQS